jgi:hypothetical protein
LSTPLHAPDVLVELASGPPGLARDWANTRLAVQAPDRVVALPSDTYDGALVMAAGARAALGVVRDGLQGQDTTLETALRAEQLTAMGLLPKEPDGWVDAVREAIRGDGAPRDLYLAQLLAELDALDGRSLAAASAVTGPEAEMALPALVLRYAAREGGDGPEALDPTATAVAQQLQARAVTPVGVRNVLALLGVPHLVVGDLDDEAAVVAAVAARMGVETPSHPRSKGAPRRRAQKVVRHLLDGIEGPAAAMVRAASDAEIGEARGLVAAAAWAHLRSERPPVEAVLHELAGEDRRVLAEARRAMLEADASGWTDALHTSVTDARLELCPAVLLVVDGTTAGMDAEPWLEPMLERFVRDPDIDVRSGLATTLVFARSPDRVAQLLGERATRSAGLLFARLAPTEEVLEALLGLPIPGGEDQLELYAHALAEMADPSVVPALQRVVDGGHRAGVEALARAQELLGS